MKLTDLRAQLHEKTRGPRGKVGARKKATQRKSRRQAAAASRRTR